MGELAVCGRQEILSDISQMAFKSMRSYPKCAALVMDFPPQLSDSLILVSWSCPEGHVPIIPVIQAYLSRTFHLAVDFLGLRRNRSWSQIINQAQDFLEQTS